MARRGKRARLTGWACLAFFAVSVYVPGQTEETTQLMCKDLKALKVAREWWHSFLQEQLIADKHPGLLVLAPLGNGVSGAMACPEQPRLGVAKFLSHSGIEGSRVCASRRCFNSSWMSPQGLDIFASAPSGESQWISSSICPPGSPATVIRIASFPRDSQDGRNRGLGGAP